MTATVYKLEYKQKIVTDHKCCVEKFFTVSKVGPNEFVRVEHITLSTPKGKEACQ
jgi:hypothetical protein